MNVYKDAEALLSLAARTLKQAEDKARTVDTEFAGDLSSLSLAAACHLTTWRTKHAKQLTTHATHD